MRAPEWVDEYIEIRKQDEDGLWPTTLDALVQLAIDVTDHYEASWPPKAEIIQWVKAAYPTGFSQIAGKLTTCWKDGVVPEEWK